MYYVDKRITNAFVHLHVLILQLKTNDNQIHTEGADSYLLDLTVFGMFDF